MWKIDETSRLCLTSKNAYGEKGCPELDVPPDADLEYEITVKGFERVCQIKKFMFFIFCLFYRIARLLKLL